ncbi:MAG: NAD(P)/FAD-dependent oxidoreductase [Candidatus Saccharibacteria bacterium]|nr:NAD(P)/FAD-dependent oxidoreductase [Candidatus Saccharibacteria bacterium]
MGTNNTYDLIVLGTGGAGYQVAMRAKEAGKKVALINDGLFGGTCSVRGCIPKKVLAGTAEIADINRRLADLDIVASQPAMNWSSLITFKRSFTDDIPSSTENSIKEAGIDVFTGSPRFTDNLTLEVNGSTLTADKVHIAVGAKPAKLPIDGFKHMITSDDFLELDELPKRIIFVGGGYISFEFAHIASRFGAEVTILHGDDKPVAMFDDDMVKELLSASEEIGIKTELNQLVTSIEKTADTFLIKTKSGQSFEADLVMHGAGRPPAIAELNLEATNVEFDLRRGVIVNEHLQSVSNPNVYAAGDAAAAGPPLSPVAGVQGSIVAKNILGGNLEQPNYLSTPSVLFTTPVVASVGHNEASATQSQLEYDVINKDTSGWFDAKRLNQIHSKSKVLVEKKSGKIIGAHLIGNHTEDLINIFSLAIELGLTTDDIKKPIMAFPTASDDMRSMF